MRLLVCTTKQKRFIKKRSDDLDLANILLSKADLEVQFGMAEKALALYDKAGKRYQQMKDDLGRANVLRGKGDLKRRYSPADEVLALYDEAEKLFY